MPRAKKSLGQHFLTDPAICRRIVSLLETQGRANSAGGENILEIGPGPGALTRTLISLRPARLLLLEKDQYWAGHWQQECPSCEVIGGDALQFPWENMQGRWKLAGNLPYNIASPLIWDIVSRCRAWDRAVFMVQKEVGLRLCASPGTGQYGALSVWAQSHAKPFLAFKLGPGAFQPPPKVDSAVVVFTPLEGLPPYPQILNVVLKICFQKRRKQLGNILRPYLELLAAMESMGIDMRLRPEELMPEQFLALAAAWAAAKPDMVFSGATQMRPAAEAAGR